MNGLDLSPYVVVKDPEGGRNGSGGSIGGGDSAVTADCARPEAPLESQACTEGPSSEASRWGDGGQAGVGDGVELSPAAGDRRASNGTPFPVGGGAGIAYQKDARGVHSGAGRGEPMGNASGGVGVVHPASAEYAEGGDQGGAGDVVDHGGGLWDVAAQEAEVASEVAARSSAGTAEEVDESGEREVAMVNAGVIGTNVSYSSPVARRVGTRPGTPCSFVWPKAHPRC